MRKEAEAEAAEAARAADISRKIVALLISYGAVE